MEPSEHTGNFTRMKPWSSIRLVARLVLLIHHDKTDFIVDCPYSNSCSYDNVWGWLSETIIRIESLTLAHS
jgi:hypothetical protein